MAKPGLYRVRDILGSGGSPGSGDAWGDPVDDDIIPNADGVWDIGSLAARFAAAYLDALDVAGNITVTGTVDGRDVSADGLKLDGIESGATADQTDSEIETAYNNQVDIVSQVEAEAGVSSTVRRWTAQRVAQAIAALETYGTASELLAALLTVDGSGSGLDADTVDGVEASAFLQDVEDDTSPSLGGTLDGAGNAAIGVALGVNAQTGTSYTLVLSDSGKMVTLSNASPITLTVPPNSSVAFPAGTKVHLLQKGAGQVTIAAGSGVTVNSPTGNLTIDAQYGMVTLYKDETNVWYVDGRLTP